MDEIIIHQIAAIAQRLGILHERAYRDMCIRLEFDRLKKQGVKVEEAEIILSKRFSSKKNKLTPESIHRIIYNRT